MCANCIHFLGIAPDERKNGLERIVVDWNILKPRLQHVKLELKRSVACNGKFNSAVISRRSS